MSFTLQRLIWDIPDLSDKDFRILSFYAFTANDTTFLAWPKIETVAEKCQCSVRTVQYSLKRLFARKDNIIFTVNRKGGRTTTTMQMFFPGMEKPGSKKKPARVIQIDNFRRARGPSTKKLAADLERLNERIDTLFQEGQG